MYDYILLDVDYVRDVVATFSENSYKKRLDYSDLENLATHRFAYISRDVNVTDTSPLEKFSRALAKMNWSVLIYNINRKASNEPDKPNTFDRAAPALFMALHLHKLFLREQNIKIAIVTDDRTIIRYLDSVNLSQFFNVELTIIGPAQWATDRQLSTINAKFITFGEIFEPFLTYSNSDKWDIAEEFTVDYEE